MSRRELLLMIYMFICGAGMGFAIGGMVEHQNTLSARRTADYCVEVTKTCINYLTDCRAGR